MIYNLSSKFRLYIDNFLFGFYEQAFSPALHWWATYGRGQRLPETLRLRRLLASDILRAARRGHRDVARHGTARACKGRIFHPGGDLFRPAG